MCDCHLRTPQVLLFELRNHPLTTHPARPFADDVGTARLGEPCDLYEGEDRPLVPHEHGLRAAQPRPEYPVRGDRRTHQASGRPGTYREKFCTFSVNQPARNFTRERRPGARRRFIACGSGIGHTTKKFTALPTALCTNNAYQCIEEIVEVFLERWPADDGAEWNAWRTVRWHFSS